MTGIFGLVGKLVKKKFSKEPEPDVGQQYIALKFEIEEMAIAEGYRFKQLYLMGEADSYRLLGRERHDRLCQLREQMSQLYLQLEPHERAHHALDRGDEDLF
jgi:hypothetical protein